MDHDWMLTIHIRETYAISNIKNAVVEDARPLGRLTQKVETIPEVPVRHLTPL